MNWDQRDEYVAGLRELADYLETTELDMQYEESLRIDLFTWSEDQFAEQSRKLGGFREKVVEGAYAIVRRNFGPHKIEVNIPRNKVCRCVQVGERVVPATEERVEPVYEWECPEGFTASGKPILEEVRS